MATEIFDFENADIGLLAIHVRETMHRRKVTAVQVRATPATGVFVATGPGYLLGATLQDITADVAEALFTDGPPSQGVILAETGAGISPDYSTTMYPPDGIPFTNELWISDSAETDSYSGVVIIATHPHA